MTQRSGHHSAIVDEAQQQGDGDAVSTKQRLEGLLLPTKKKLEGLLLPTKKRLEKLLFSLQFWNKMFVTACLIAVSLDPLFFYIPVIHRMKCLAVDDKLKTVALILRALTDVTFLVHIAYHVHRAFKAAYKEHKEKTNPESEPEFSMVSTAEIKIIPFAIQVAGKLYWHPTLISILAVFPMPQYLLVFVFFDMRGNGYLENRKILNVFLLAQYLPRIYQIHLSSHKLRHSTGIWAKALFNFFLYILASHVLGAFWYFFAIQRETSCWYRACEKIGKNPGDCMRTIYCLGRITTDEILKALDDSCPISDEATAETPFNFGIFLDALKNNITRNADFGTKLSYSFWWGLRNISNFGTNLITSTYVWETCFAVLISIIGLLLFLYLIGNVQTFMSMETQRWEEIRNKIQSIEKYIADWKDENEVPDHMMQKMKKNIERKLEENKDTDLTNIFSIFSKDIDKERSLMRFIGLKLLKKVPKLARMDEYLLELLCDHLKPVTYDVGKEIGKERLDSMLLITGGTVLRSRTTTSNVSTQNAQKGSSSSSPSGGNQEKVFVYAADELIDWVTNSSDLTKLPRSDFSVKCDSKVEGFELKAEDLLEVVSKYKSRWRICINQSIGQLTSQSDRSPDQNRS